MQYPRQALALALLATAGTAFAHGDDAHGAPARSFDAARVEATAFGQEGDPSRATRTVQVRMTDRMRFEPARLAVRKGETIRFLVENRGALFHEMVLGTPADLARHAELMKKFPGMQHEDANIAHVRPGARGEMTWQFTQAGEFEFACLVPGHYEAGMIGKVVVK